MDFLRFDKKEKKITVKRRKKRENSLDITGTPIISSDVADNGKSLFQNDNGMFRYQMDYKTVTEEQFELLRNKYKDYGFSLKRDAETFRKDVSNHYHRPKMINANDVEKWEQLNEEENKLSVKLEGYWFYFYYFLILVIIQFGGPIAGLFLFMIPGLRNKRGKEYSIKFNFLCCRWNKTLKFSGWQVPFMDFFIYCCMWLAGEGPMLLNNYWHGFHRFVKSDVPMQAYSRMCLMMIILFLYRCKVIHAWIDYNEIKYGGWKFEEWKDELGFDEGTFEFDLINAKGELTQRQIPGIRLLPHIKPWPKVDLLLSKLKYIVPLCFLTIYSLDLSDPAGSIKFPDPKHYWTNKDGTLLDFDQIRRNIQFQVSPFGNGKRDFCISMIGYIVEIVLIRYFYCLLWHTVCIHIEFFAYCQRILRIQNYHCTAEELDAFYLSSQHEEFYLKSDAVKSGRDISDSVIGELVCAEIAKTDYSHRLHTVNTKFRAPLDPVNIKNIQNIKIVRQIAFRIYQPLAMQAQYIIIYMTVVFIAATYIIFLSMYTPTSTHAYFYGLYYPKELWWYGVFFVMFYLVPVLITFFIVFFFELFINTNIIWQNELWERIAENMQRLQAMESHYFNVDNKALTFTANHNSLLVIKEKEDFETEALNSRINFHGQEMFQAVNQTKRMAKIQKKFYENERAHIISFSCESDNPYFAYLVKRFVEDYSDKGKQQLYFVFKLYIDAYQAAIAAISDEGEQLVQNFYFFGVFPLNRSLLYTLLGLVFWQSFSLISSLLTDATQ